MQSVILPKNKHKSQFIAAVMEISSQEMTDGCIFAASLGKAADGKETETGLYYT
jgi:hypothetical protein